MNSQMSQCNRDCISNTKETCRHAWPLSWTCRCQAETFPKRAYLKPFDSVPNCFRDPTKKTHWPVRQPPIIGVCSPNKGHRRKLSTTFAERIPSFPAHFALPSHLQPTPSIATGLPRSSSIEARNMASLAAACRLSARLVGSRATTARGMFLIIRRQGEGTGA